VLGGSTMRYENEHVAGKFGEGMKLAALALLREGCDLKISTGVEVWDFSMEVDELFDDEQCLFVNFQDREERIIDISNQKYVHIEITNINEQDWMTFRRRILKLSDIPRLFISIKNVGEILLADEYKGDSFVKGIWVSNCLRHMGYNLFKNCDLDRDRKMLANIDEYRAQVSALVATILNTMVENPEMDRNLPDYFTWDQDNLQRCRVLWKIVYDATHRNELYNLHKDISILAADELWRVYRARNPETQPYCHVCNHEERVTSLKLAPYSHHLDHFKWATLVHSQYYLTPTNWLRNCTNGVPKVLGQEEEQAKLEALQIIQNFKNVTDIVILIEGVNCIVCFDRATRIFFVHEDIYEAEKQIWNMIGADPVSIIRFSFIALVKRAEKDILTVEF